MCGQVQNLWFSLPYLWSYQNFHTLTCSAKHSKTRVKRYHTLLEVKMPKIDTFWLSNRLKATPFCVRTYLYSPYKGVPSLRELRNWACNSVLSLWIEKLASCGLVASFALFTVPPEIRQLSNITANEGDDEVLNCTASGFPLPTVVWFKDNEEYPRQLVGSYIQCVKDL